MEMGMLSPSELREEATCCRREWRRKEDANVPGDSRDLVLADLCEQVAELREHRDAFRSTPLSGNPTITIKPAPRKLKASEITVPGRYACRLDESDEWDMCEVAVDDSGCASSVKRPGDFITRMSFYSDWEFYGPLDLPE